MSKEMLSTSKEIPKHKNALEEKYKAQEEKEPLNPDNIKAVTDQLPEPSGWRLLVLPYVIKVGPLAYHDKEKFPTGPWCKKGQWVIFARYAGSRLPIEGGEVRLLNDDEVLGTIENPESVLHHV